MKIEITYDSKRGIVWAEMKQVSRKCILFKKYNNLVCYVCIIYGICHTVYMDDIGVAKLASLLSLFANLLTFALWPAGRKVILSTAGRGNSASFTGRERASHGKLFDVAFNGFLPS